MFLRRQPRNRRLGREYVLDVKLRSSQVRKARSRLLAMIGGGLLGLALVGYVLWRGAAWGMDRLVYENPAFAIHGIDLQTDGVIAPDQLRLWAGLTGHENLLGLDLARVKQNLETAPFVESVSIERILPHTLRIRVTEREPVAEIQSPRLRTSGLTEPIVYHLDVRGFVMPQLAPNQRAVPPNAAAEQYPLITGVKLNREPEPGKRLDLPQVKAALQLILAFGDSRMAQIVDLKRVDASQSDVLVATTGQGSEITFGLADFDKQLRRWRETQEMAQRLGKGISTLDLAVANNIPAKWMDASAVPPSPPKLPKSLRTRKKHV
jgi:cell division septal protein FtsQ